MHIVWAFYETVLKMAPWLLFGFLAAGLLSLFFTPEKVHRYLGKQVGKRAIALAVLLGVPLPLCSCGVLPVAVGMRKGGASKGATAAFLISTPQTGVDSFFATGALLGWVFAVIRPCVAFVSGLLGGVIVDAMDKAPVLTPTLTPESSALTTGGWGRRLPAALRYGYVTLLGNVAWALFVGLLISALILVFVPEDFFGGVVPANDWIVFPLMLLIGIPMYVCSTASIPVALAFMAKGISPGAALVFLIVGPALNGASLTTLLTLLGKRCTLIHLLVISVSAVLAGLLLNQLAFLLPEYTTATVCCDGGDSTTLFTHLCGGVLLALLLYHLVVKPCLMDFRPVFSEDFQQMTHTITVKGMHCAHCRGAVENLLKRYPTVTAVTQLPPDAFAVQGTLPDTLANDIAELGFTLEA